jgi:SOS response associated peptidase (SRAP)
MFRTAFNHPGSRKHNFARRVWNHNVAGTAKLWSHQQHTLNALPWGLISHWAKDPKIAYKTINARVETVDTAPSYRQAFNPDSEAAFGNFGICRVRRGGVSTWGGTNLFLRKVEGLNHEEVLRLISEHRFRPRGQIPKIGIWVQETPLPDFGRRILRVEKGWGREDSVLDSDEGRQSVRFRPDSGKAGEIQ